MIRRFAPVIAVLLLVLSAAAQDEPEPPITQVPYRHTLMFLPVHVEALGRENVQRRTTGVAQKDMYLGFGVGIIAGYPGPLKWQATISFESLPAEKIDVLSITNISVIDAQFGFRLLTHKPTFGIGRVPVRLTAAVQGGASMIKAGSWTPAVRPAATLSAGLFISYEDNPYGLMVEFVYHPLAADIDLKGQSDLLQAFIAIKSSWAIRFSWMFSGGTGE
jgi:hypothetical protein